MTLPSWWLEATVPSLVFGTMLVLLVLLPGRPGHDDFGSKVRTRLVRLVRRGR